MGGRKDIELLECEQIIHHFKARDLEIPNIYLFPIYIYIAKYLNFAKIWAPHEICCCSIFSFAAVISPLDRPLLDNGKPAGPQSYTLKMKIIIVIIAKLLA